MDFNIWKKIKKFGNSVSDFIEEVNRQVEEDQRIEKLQKEADLLFENTKALIEMGKQDQVENTLLDLISKYKEFLSHENIAECLKNLADISISKNEISEAERFINESMLETEKAFYNSDHLFKAYVLDRMALIEIEKGDTKRAECCYIESLRIKEKLLLQPYSGGLSSDGFMIPGGEIIGANRDIDKAEIAKTAAHLAVLLYKRSNSKANSFITRSLELFEELDEDQYRFNDSGANCLYDEPSQDIHLILSELSKLYDQNKELIHAANLALNNVNHFQDKSVNEKHSHYTVDDKRWYHDETFYDNVQSSEESTKAELKREKNDEQGLPERSHFPWTVFEKEKLVGQFQLGNDLEELSEVFERSPTAISAQLKNLGIISEEEHDDYFASYQKQKIKAEFNKYGVSSLWHMTHRDNIETILEKGVLSHSLAYKLTKPTDISEHGVQERRDFKDPIFNRNLHEYAVTYINIKNPMLYAKQGANKELCLIEISLSVLSNGKFIFSDGNAASSQTGFSNKVNDLSELPWNVLNSKYWSDIDDGKRKRCAEVMILNSIKPEHIKTIHCSSQDTLEHLSKYKVHAVISPELFFYDNNSGRSDDDNDILLDF